MRASAGEEINYPPKARVFCGLIYTPEMDPDKVLLTLEQEWGSVALISRSCSFAYTEYYLKEMGEHLQRKFIIFDKLVAQASLPKLKWKAKSLEKGFLNQSGGRQVNIDPGLLLPDKLVLATTKPCSHRPYLGKGIYADITLVYHNKSYQSLPWTYPDYAAQETVQMLNVLRKRYSPVK